MVGSCQKMASLCFPQNLHFATLYGKESMRHVLSKIRSWEQVYKYCKCHHFGLKMVNVLLNTTWPTQLVPSKSIYCTFFVPELTHFKLVVFAGTIIQVFDLSVKFILVIIVCKFLAFKHTSLKWKSMCSFTYLSAHNLHTLELCLTLCLWYCFV